MTNTQAAIYAFINEFRAVHPYGPTYREVAAECGVCFQRVHQVVTEMQWAGIVRHDPSIARSLDTILVAESELLDTLQTDSGSSEPMAAVTEAT